MTRILLAALALTGLVFAGASVPADPPLQGGPPVLTPAGYIVNWSSPPDGIAADETTAWVEGVWITNGACSEPPTEGSFLWVTKNTVGTPIATSAVAVTLTVTYEDPEAGIFAGTWEASYTHQGLTNYVTGGAATLNNYNAVTDTVTLTGTSSVQTTVIP